MMKSVVRPVGTNKLQYGDANRRFAAGPPWDGASITADLTGNADTATKLQTARTINGVAFDGTANITVAAAAGTLTGTTLASNVVNSSLATVGTITAGTWNATIIGTAYGGTGVDNSTGGTANTFWARPNGATGAATYRAIVAADVPTLNQNTTGSAATLTTTRTIWGQNFNGSANVAGGLTSADSMTPTSNGAGSVGSATLSYSNLYLASGGTINFANGDVVVTHSSGKLSLGTSAFQAGAPTFTGTVALTYAAGSGLLEKTSTAGGAGSCQSIVKSLTALADGGTGTTLFAVTVPNINCAAAFLIILTGSIGDDSTLNYDSTDTVLYALSVSRIAGSNTINTLGTKFGQATTTGATTGNHTAAVTLTQSGLAGGPTAQQTFNVRVIVTPSAGTYGKNIAMARIICLNEIASGITIA